MSDDAKREVIHAAAVAEFSRRGFAGTSMANIADAASMSRPALYQHFRNKGDIFASAFTSLIEAHADAALDELTAPGAIGDQLNNFLQRFDGDLWEHMAASPYSEEIMSAKNDEVLAKVAVAATRLWDGVASHVAQLAPNATAVQRADWVDVLHYSPKGFKLDQPSIEVYRRRLGTLARGVAAEIAAAS